MNTFRYTRRSAPSDWLDTDGWTQADTGSLSDDERSYIQSLMGLIKDYILGKSVSKDLSTLGIPWEAMLRAFNRCLAPDGFNRRMGWRGLLPYLHVKPNVRNKPLHQSGRWGRGGLSGALQLLWRERPSLRQAFDGYLFRNATRKAGSESGLRSKSAHQYFLELCKKDGLTEQSWPLSAIKKGKSAIASYTRQFLEAHYDDIVATQFGSKARAKANTGTGYFTQLTASRVFDLVELDEHRLHFVGTIGIPTDEGVRWIATPRLILILVVDRKHQYVLGFKLRCRPEADTDDMLDALDAAFGNQPEHTYSSAKLEDWHERVIAPEDACRVSCAFNAAMLDGALIHTSGPVIGRARDLGGFDINIGPVARPERRPNAEGIFGDLSRSGFHRLASTTGTGPGDPRRQDAEGAAQELRMEWPEVLDLVHAIIAHRNHRPGKRNLGIGAHARLREIARDDDALGMLYPLLPPLPMGIPGLDTTVLPLTVRGNKKSGRRPYVYFDEEDYFGEVLKDRWDLLDQPIVGHVRRHDIRKIRLFTQGGDFIDEVAVRGRWRHSPHSRDLRKHVNKLIRDGYLKMEYDQDPVHVHLDDLRARLQRDRADERRGTRAMVDAHAEHVRSQTEQAANTAQAALAAVVAKHAEPEPVEPEASDGHATDVDWSDAGTAYLDELTAINGDTK